MKLGKVIAVAAVATTLNIVPFQDANAWTTWGGGTSFSTYGNTSYGSDGSMWSTYGNTTYGNWGSSFGSGGVTCTSYGNTVYCN